MKKKIVATIICLILALGGGGVVGYFLYPIIPITSIEDNTKQDDEVVAELNAMIETLRGQMNTIQESEKNKTIEIQSLKIRLTTIETEMSELLVTNEENLEKIKLLTAEKEELIQERDTYQDQLDEAVVEINKRIDAIDLEISELLNSNALIQASISDLESEQVTIKSQLNSLQEEVSGIQNTISQINLQIVELQTKVLKIQNSNMSPSDEIVTDMETVPVAGQIYFEAPSNGVLYIRIAVESAGEVGMHLRALDDTDLAYNTQKLDGNSDVYNATFVMRAGQKIYCYEFSAGYLWGGYSFVKSETN